MENRDLICIRCPLGCMLTVEIENEEVISVTGNTCPRGKTYAEKEVINPMRIVTSSVRVLGGERANVSCKTNSEIPKNKIFDVARALKDIEVQAPVYIGDVLIEDVAHTGVSIVATSNVER